MSGGPYNMGPGRNGPGVLLGRRPSDVAQGKPYRPELAQEEHVALGDIVIVALAASREAIEVNGTTIAVPEAESPYHVVLAAGPKVADIVGAELDPGDVVVIEGGKKVETPAGSIWFLRAPFVLSVVLPKDATSDCFHSGWADGCPVCDRKRAAEEGPPAT